MRAAVGKQPRRASRHAWLAAMALVWLASACARAADLPSEFVQQYAPAVERMRQFYTHVTINGTLNRDLPQSGKTLEQQFVYRASGVQIRLELTTMANKGFAYKVGGWDMYMATKDGSLTTTRRPTSPVFDDARQLKYADTKNIIEQTCQMTYPFTIAGHATLLDFLQQASVTAVKITRFTRDGATYYRLSFTEVAGREDRQKTWKSWFVLSPFEGWAVREYSRTVGEGEAQITYRGALAYGSVDGGVPLVSQIESIVEKGPRQTRAERQVILVTKIQPGDPPTQTWTAFDF